MARISPLPPNEWPPEMREAFAALRPPHTTQPALRTEGRPRALNALGTLAHHTELARAFNTFNGHILYTSTLSARQRELLVLRVASLRSSEYEWAQHVVLAADVGLTDDEIARIAIGSEAPGWPPLDRAMLRAAEELVGEGMVSDADMAGPGRSPRGEAAHGPGLHRRDLRDPGHGLPVLWRRAR